jgi:hypothetical protein
MSIKNGALVGAGTGAFIAVLMMTLVSVRPFPVAFNGVVEKLAFKLCPLYIFGFSNYVSSMTTLFFVTILGNALLYGLLGVLIATGVVLFRRVAHKVS